MNVSSIKGMVALCAILSLQTPALEALTKLTNVARKLLPDTREFLLTAEFESDSKPEAVWYWFNGYYSRPSNPTLTYGQDSGNPQKGTASLTVAIEDRRLGGLFLSLGELDSQYLDVMWDTSGSQSMTLALDFPMSTVTPGTNVTYRPGERVQVSFAVEENRGREVLNINYGSHVYVVLIGDFHNAATGEFVTDGPATELMQNTYKRENGISTSTVDFRTDQYTVNGIFTGFLSGAVNAVNTPLLYASEHFVVSVHEEQNKGPFPDGTVVAKIDTGMTVCVANAESCDMACTAYGNGLDTVHMYKENPNGERELQTTLNVGDGKYKRRVQLRVDNHSHLGFTTKFVCKATLTDGKEAEDAATLYVLGK